jgi:hypothetical protein
LALSPLLGGGEDPNVMGMMGKLILEFKFESLVVHILKDGVSVLMDVFKQFANKNIFECIKDGFPDALLRCMNPQAPQSSINDDVSKSEPGRNYMKPQINWVTFLFPHHMESMQLYELQSFSIMLPMMNLTRKAIPHSIFNVTYPGNSTISLLGICSTRCRP